MVLPDEEAARFATDAWVKRVADVPLDEVPVMVLEDPSVVSALVGALRHERRRRDDLLATIVRITQETPLAEEVKEALEQRGKLLAEIGTLRQQVNAMAEVVAASNVLRNRHRDVFNDVSPNTDTGRWCMALDAFNATR